MVFLYRDWVKVKNRKGSGDEYPSDGSSSWKEFWEDRSNQSFGQCACRQCNSKATDGAHVIKADSKDRAHYIVPLCHSCNKKPMSESFEVRGDLLVPVSDD